MTISEDMVIIPNSNREKKMSNISAFKATMVGGGARSNQFRVAIQFPTWVSGGLSSGAALTAPYLCKAAELPASSIQNVPVQYRGRQVNFAGERTFNPWTIQIINDTPMLLRRALEDWSNGIQNYDNTFGIAFPMMYQETLSVEQLDRTGVVIRKYTFHDAYPTFIGDIPLSFDSPNVIEEYQVTFDYNYFTIDV